ncbi:DUF115 domain-containing protein [Aestuariibacter sp. AA17]|uniref:DUF115 domain-containing protein n=1 Tax=Fluctibacter corallii TaxID=2984329 RepID=A0ABT3A4M5_9ALTE|nr:6-hydroxymethylpterin diphosphokinase MptE-like protein [Aestuariibacter sp. AA17]MCV2883494.1 DUF115 domain-containing protein [Aestuariibacter sp. AA17]
MALFKKNLNFLRTFQKPLYNKLRRLKPKKIKSSKNGLDLIIHGESFYGGNARSASCQQVDFFFQHPMHFSLKYQSKQGNTWFHQIAINGLNDLALSLNYQEAGRPTQSNLFILGTGLGLFIESLNDWQRFKNVIIVEPSSEMLFHFLHHVDIEELNNSCIDKGGRLVLLQPNSISHFNEMMNSLLDKLGEGFLSEVTVFRHYETELFDYIYNNFRELRDGWVSAWGFYDDEVIGVEHSYKNTKIGKFYSKTQSNIQSELLNKPVVIVGNGPSLDKQIGQLKSLENKVIIVSCGTSVGALVRAGITPHFHAEMERSLFTVHVQKKWFTPSLCDTTTLLALNTVSPEITEKFTHKVMFCKHNDLGSYYLNSIANRELATLKYCNPTVTNFAVSACLNMGFESFFLVGCDYGFYDQNKHHSSNSDYYDSQECLSKVTLKEQRSEIGNDGRVFYTTRIFRMARASMEQLIDRNRNKKFYNCSDGASIKGTSYYEIQDLHSQLKDDIRREKIQLLIDDPSLVEVKCDNKLGHFLENELKFLKELLDGLDMVSDKQLLNYLNLKKNELSGNINSHLLLSGVFKYVLMTIEGHINRLSISEVDMYLKGAALELKKLFNSIYSNLATLTKGM